MDISRILGRPRARVHQSDQHRAWDLGDRHQADRGHPEYQERQGLAAASDGPDLAQAAEVCPEVVVAQLVLSAPRRRWERVPHRGGEWRRIGPPRVLGAEAEQVAPVQARRTHSSQEDGWALSTRQRAAWPRVRIGGSARVLPA